MISALNNKQIEMFRRVEEAVVIVQPGFQLCHLITRIAGNNAVNQRRTESVSIIQPRNECCRQRPLLCIAQHQFTQGIAVVVDEFARNDNPAFIRCPVKVGKALEQQTRQFGRIADSWRIVKLIPRVIADARLRGIGEDKPYVRVMGERQKFIVLAVDADFTIYGTNKTRIAYRFSLLIQTTNNCGIQTILVLSDGGKSLWIGRTITTPALRSVCSFKRSICQSTNARRKLPSPNWMIRSG